MRKYDRIRFESLGFGVCACGDGKIYHENVINQIKIRLLEFIR